MPCVATRATRTNRTNRNSAIEVFARHSVEPEDVILAKGATWGLEARLDLSGGDALGCVEGRGGGQRIALRRGQARPNRLARLVARLTNQHGSSGPPSRFAWPLRHPVNLELEEALHEVQPKERLDEPGRAGKRHHRWRRLKVDLDVGNAGRMKRRRDVAPTHLDRGLLALTEIA